MILLEIFYFSRGITNKCRNQQKYYYEQDNISTTLSTTKCKYNNSFFLNICHVDILKEYKLYFSNMC